MLAGEADGFLREAVTLVARDLMEAEIIVGFAGPGPYRLSATVARGRALRRLSLHPAAFARPSLFHRLFQTAPLGPFRFLPWQRKGPVSRAFPHGRCRARTSDLLLVRQALSQLS